MQQLVKRIVKCSVSLDAHAHDCIVSKAAVNVIRRTVSAECVGIARKSKRRGKKWLFCFTEIVQTQLNLVKFYCKFGDASEKSVPIV